MTLIISFTMISMQLRSSTQLLLFLSIDFSDIAISVLLLLFIVFALSDLFMLKRRFSKFKCSRLFEGGHLFEGRRLFKGGRLLDNLTFRMGAYSRVGAYSRAVLIRSITVFTCVSSGWYELVWCNSKYYPSQRVKGGRLFEGLALIQGGVYLIILCLEWALIR